MIRILLNIRPESFRQLLLERIAGESDLEVVGEANNPLDLLVLVGRTGADVVLQTWDDSGEPPGVCSHLLAEFPDLLIIGITSYPEQVYACRQVIRKTSLPSATLPVILSAIRARENDDPSPNTTATTPSGLWSLAPSQYRLGHPHVN